MIKILLVAGVFLGSLFGTYSTLNLNKDQKYSVVDSKTTSFDVSDSNKVVLKNKVELKSNTNFVEAKKLKIIILEERNTITFRMQVDSSSVGRVMQELNKKSRKLNPSENIFLVLDTPGGSVFDGLDLIDFTDALPNKVDTVTIFAASMGFNFAQAMNKRYITRNGVLMSHRAALGGLGGQLDGEFETRYRMIKRFTDALDSTASIRMGMDLDKYKAMIKDEYWVSGFDSVEDKAADEQVLLRCGESLKGTDVLVLQTFFGPVAVEFDKCPLIKEPVSIKFERNTPAEEKKKIESAVNLMIKDKTEYYNKYIKTGEFSKLFKTK